MDNKSLKFLVDVGVGRQVEKWLKEKGYNIESIRDKDPKMDDEEILGIAVSEGRMVITMDKDFGELVYNSKLLHKGVLLLRVEEANADEKIKIIKEILEKYSDSLFEKFCVFKDGRLRIRK